jgi:pimeloyl-ACP methyl ester carboxylesterase
MRQFTRNSIDRAGQAFHGRGAVLLAVGAVMAAALFVRHKTRQAERAHPPIGQFIEVDGVRLHYVERGQGQPLVLLHGNGSMIEDFDISGLLGLAANQYRVIAFDRPGFGYSERPRGKIWTPDAQADLLYHALQRLGVEHPIVVGHSWGTLVALALALKHPDYVRSLVLLSGYYYPGGWIDAALLAPSTVPALSSLMRHTVSPLLSRLLWPAMVRRLFGPSAVSARFAALFPLWMTLRPSQLRASAAESALMIPSAAALHRRYAELTMPVVIVAGEGDRIVNAHHSAHLHEDLLHSELHLAPGAGHMIHYVALHQVMAAINSAEEAAAQADATGMAPVQTLHSDAPIPTMAPERT